VIDAKEIGDIITETKEEIVQLICKEKE